VNRTSDRRRRSPPPHGGGRLLATHAPTLAGNEWRYVRECLETGWVSSAGPFVTRFEDAVAAYSGARHAVATVTGSAALHVALQVVGVQPGDEVLLPDLTFIAPFSAVRYCGASPVLLDVERRSWQLDADQLAAFLAEECVVRGGRCFNRRSGRRVRAVVPVHLLGLACEIDRIVAIARRHRLAVVEDAAQAMGVRYRGRHVGTFGDVGIVSFNGNKIVTAGGGGALLTDNAARAARARRLTTHARRDDRPDSIHSEVGYNYRLSNLQAAVGLAQMERLDALIARQRQIAAAYQRGFASLAGVEAMPLTPHTDATYWLYTIQLTEPANVERRQRVLRALSARGIGARTLWSPLHRQPPARGCQRYRLRNAPRLFARSISLPSSADLTLAEVRRCVGAVAAALAG
jgi:perosamine synthetase